MIPLRLGVLADAEKPFVARLNYEERAAPDSADAFRISETPCEAAFASSAGLFTLDTQQQHLDGDVIFVEPTKRVASRIIRASSRHNTLLVTEQCDQLCVMCSQPPKKTHVDRFKVFKEACLLAPHGIVIGVSGGEPTLHKHALFELIEEVLTLRPDLSFHVLTNGQHFETDDIPRLRQDMYRAVTWGVPLYSAAADLHDRIVGKDGAFARLEESFRILLTAGASIELRTVVMRSTVQGLDALARHIWARLSFISSWSIMQLENTGFAKNRWGALYFDHSEDFGPLAAALDYAELHRIGARLFNFPLCTVPACYRHLAPASISDWKRKFDRACEPCSLKDSCSGFFEWHPNAGLNEKVKPL